MPAGLGLVQGQVRLFEEFVDRIVFSAKYRDANAGGATVGRVANLKTGANGLENFFTLFSGGGDCLFQIGAQVPQEDKKIVSALMGNGVFLHGVLHQALAHFDDDPVARFMSQRIV